ncbi:MAG: SRPBCC family protein, partial [Solirubrobacterales bacterium]|nr:SRPBCC family protein [Solirubrobacterales bacterium]
RVGASRRVELSDKSTAHEQLTGYERPNHFSYRLDEFTGPLALLVSHVEGSWRFSAGPSATHVGWTYAFHPRRGRALIIRRLVAPVWRRYQQRVMNLAADEAAVVLS